MKQSKKLLSIFLAMLMLLGSFSVVANAASYKQQKVEKGTVVYDSMDNAALTAEQVAFIICDMLDNELLCDIDVNIEFGSIKLNLTSVDNVFASLDSVAGIAGGILGGLLGDLKNLKFDAVKGKPTRAGNGDLTLLVKLLQFLADNSSLLSKAVYGIGTSNGIDLGSVISGFIDLGDINKILENLPTFLAKTVYDMLIYGSYGTDSEPNRYSKDSAAWGTLPGEVDTLDEMLAVAIKGFLVNPQQYSYVDGQKVWDMDSRILGAKGAELNLDLATNSIFSILDMALPVAYETFGTVVLNHDVKKIFMEAMGADFVVLDPVKDKTEIEKITKSGTGYIDPDGTNSAEVKNYFCNAQMWKVGDTWYFRDYVTRDVLDANGDPVMENGEVKTAKQHRYQRAEAYDVDELFEAVNWDYYLTASDLNFKTLIPQYGSLVGCLNHILRVVFEKALNPAYLAKMGTSVNALWADGGNENFNENLMRVAKFLLTNYTFMFFGRNPEYVDLNTLQAKPEFVQKINSFAETDEGREGLIAYMLLPFLGDALPQLVYSTDMFTTGLQIEQTAALLVREFLTDLTPQINDNVFDYDAQIFVDPYATNKQFKTYTSEEWMNIVLNMGLDLAACYLDNIANFNVDLDTLKKFHDFATEKKVQPWQVVLEEIVDWAVLYVGKDNYSAIKGLEPSTLGVVRNVTGYDDKTDKPTGVANNYKGNAFDTVSTALNALLPLGIVNGCSSDKYSLDIQVLFNKICKDIIPTLNIEGILGLFGRNNDPHGNNFLANTNLPLVIVNLVNKLLACIINDASADPYILRLPADGVNPLNYATQQKQLQVTVQKLLNGLAKRSDDLLRGVLPVLAIFVSGWGTEQSFRTPEIDISSTMTWTETGSSDFEIVNGSKGIWRGYMQNGTRQQDQHYKMILEDVKAYDVNGNASSVLKITSTGKGTYDYGKAATVNYEITSVANALVRIEATYKVTGPDGNALSNESLKASEYVWINTTNGDERSTSHDTDTKSDMRAVAYTPFYVDASSVDSLKSSAQSKVAAYVYKKGTGSKTVGIKSGAPSADVGISYPQNIYFEGTKNTYDNDYNFVVTDAQKAYEFAQTPGAKIEWKVQGFANGKTAVFKDKTVQMFFYDGASLNQLRDLVNSEFAMRRLPSEYDTSSDAWKNYTKAFEAATRGARQNMNTSSVWNFKELYEALDSAITAVEGVKLAASNSGMINTLKSTVKTAEDTLGGKNYRTYMLYRWYKFNDELKDAKNAIELERKVALGLETQNFKYSSLTANEVTQLLALPNNGTYADFVKATFTPMTEDEAARAKSDYRNIQRDLAGYQTVDLANTNNLITVNQGRLIKRTDKPVTTYLEKEIASASGLNEADYTPMSWAVFATALKNANDAKTSDSQDTIFTAKYQLQVARNGLVAKNDGADYTELKAVIAQANAALANASSYENGAEDFGAVIAALGYEVTDANGNVINLFPGSAIDVEDIPYGTHDQDEIDDAADELKRALAKLKFKNLNTGSVGVENKEFATGEFDETTNAEIKESVLVRNVAKEQTATQVKDLVKALGDDAVVSLDGTYAAEKDTEMFVGTGSTITVYKKQGTVNVPIATIKVVVSGDVNGDGVIDVLDCSSVELASHGLVEYAGVYGLAADVATGTAGITPEDLQAVVGLALNK